jgi:hypothetical protein
MAVKNTNLHNAKQAKNDEFYTQLPDIENELRNYRDHFRGKAVLCNCDDPRINNFFFYYDAIEVSKTAALPLDYDGVMGVPI